MPVLRLHQFCLIMMQFLLKKIRPLPNIHICITTFVFIVSYLTGELFTFRINIPKENNISQRRSKISTSNIEIHIGYLENHTGITCIYFLSIYFL